jgi:hypothetical protein
MLTGPDATTKGKIRSLGYPVDELTS